MPCYSPLKGFVNKETGGILFKRSSIAGAETEVACGSCLFCRLDRTRTWAIRCVHEAQEHDANCFITLTYDDQHMKRLWNGGPGTLHKPDFQKFMKRLRKRFDGVRIRYYQCGEYGENLERPHYHACIFGLDFQDQELFAENDDYKTYTSQVLSDIWGLGFVTVGELTFESAAYTARYIMKKVTGIRAEDHYLRIDDYGVCYWLEPEYTNMSRGSTCGEHRGMPYQMDCPKCSRGIGRDWYEKYKTDLFPRDEVPVPGSGVYKKVPRYYESILRDEDPDSHQEIKRLRECFREAHGDEYSPERLMAKYKVKQAQVAQLKRGLE